MILRFLMTFLVIQTSSCSAAVVRRDVAKACTEIYAGNTTIVIKDPPSAVLGRVGAWRLGQPYFDVGSGWEIIERSEVKEVVRATSKIGDVIVSATLIQTADTMQDGLNDVCGPIVVRLSDLKIGDVDYSRDSGIVVLRAVAETGGL